MEGVMGSRMSRASSRYGPSPTAAAVFNGPVRKWKRKWVHVAPSPPPAKTPHSRSNGYNGSLHHHHHNNNNNNNNNNNGVGAGHRLLLCRWTPLSPSPSGATNSPADDASPSEEPPKRKFRYTPIVVLEQQRKAEKKAEHEAKLSGTNEFDAPQTSKQGDELNSGKALNSETQDSDASHLDLDLSLKGHDDNPDKVNQSREGGANKGSAGGFWMTG